MEHWFDRLASGEHTRRTTLKAAIAGAATLTLPLAWPGRGQAEDIEECYRFCLNAAYAGPSQKANTQCKTLREKARGKGPRSAASRAAAACYAAAAADYKRAKTKCQQPQCGDPVTYPSGNATGQPPTDTGCPEGTTGCSLGACCCGPGSGCCPCAATGGCICCVAEVKCADCCPGG